ncbi:U3 small nucleolar RNA-associated protein 14 homolog A-like [Acomys russatus]|uniref:U3 small nucleolar RNA-associated protein 14 homolog A-like n=1 Tax=Acomys russatus TaxID=60746 RepID=UPI0021E218DF|nr:U3 small nucleolar RNA-associated protein 14 homolog A-like [Acomys russatus]
MSLVVPKTVELEDKVERDQKQMIKEAFEGDNVIEEFLKEKSEVIQATKPKDIDLTLPGWGEWGGMDLKPSAKKRRRFLIKAPEGPPRKDKNLPNVIISEKRNIHAAAHQVRFRELATVVISTVSLALRSYFSTYGERDM